MSWASGDLYGGDCESTGVDVLNDRIVTFTVVKIVPMAEPVVRAWLLAVDVPIPAGATAIHNITNEYAAKHGQDPATALDEIAHTVAGVMRSGRPLVFFNAAYDLSILEAELRRHNLPSLHDRVADEHWQTIVDPMVLGKGLDQVNRNFRKGRKYTLVDLCERYKVPFMESHDATADAVGAVMLASAIADADLMIASQGPRALHQLQVTWRREMQHSLRTYFDKNGIEHDGVDGSWPLHTELLAGVHA